MRRRTEVGGENFDLFTDRFVLVHDKLMLPFDDAESTPDARADLPQVLFKNGELKKQEKLR